MIEARREALLAWYGRHRRPLPWRDEADPYLVLVSEIMAQQTQISRVVPHFERFVEQLTTGPPPLARIDRLVRRPLLDPDRGAVGFAIVRAKPACSRSSSSTNASMNRTGLSAPT